MRSNFESWELPDTNQIKNKYNIVYSDTELELIEEINNDFKNRRTNRKN